MVEMVIAGYNITDQDPRSRSPLPGRAEAEKEAHGHALRSRGERSKAVEVMPHEGHRHIDVERGLTDAEPIAEEAQRVAYVVRQATWPHRIGFALCQRSSLDEHASA